MDRSLTPVKRSRDELAFLPAALEVYETPPAPLGRAILWTIIALFTVAVIWASVGHVDIVAVARGKVVPSSRVKTIQPLSASIVRAIHVRDGQEVFEGDVLIELDPTLANADRQRMQYELDSTVAELARQRAFAEVLSGGASIEDIDLSASLSAEQGRLQQELLTEAHREYRARANAIESSLVRSQADQEAARQLTEKHAQVLPLVTERAQAMAELVQDNLAAKDQFLALEQERIEAQQELAAQRAHFDSLTAAIQEFEEERLTLIAETRRQTLLDVEALSRREAALRQELLKAETISQQQTLRAPTDGVVQQLSVHTVGGVVTPAEPLMILVPMEGALEVEAFVENKDIGFVHPHQEAEIKLDAFPFTRYGTLTGRVETLSNDAIAQENAGLVFSARVQLDKTRIWVDERWIDVSPGMATSVEIKTGTRRLLEYLISPLLRYRDESVRER